MKEDKETEGERMREITRDARGREIERGRDIDRDRDTVFDLISVLFAYGILGQKNRPN